MAIAVFLFAAFCFSSARATTGAYSYALPGYTATYDIVKMPPPDSGAINPYAYNIVVYGPPPTLS
jgi:hypothetical protein